MGHRLATTDMGQKLGEAVPLWGELDRYVKQCGLGQGLPSYTKWHLHPSNRLATIHQGYRQDRQDRQRSDSIGRTVLQTVAQKTSWQCVNTSCC